MRILLIEIGNERIVNGQWVYTMTPHLLNNKLPFVPPMDIEGYDNVKEAAYRLAEDVFNDDPSIDKIEIWCQTRAGSRFLYWSKDREAFFKLHQPRPNTKGLYVPKSHVPKSSDLTVLTPDDYLTQDPDNPNPEWDAEQREAFKRFIQGG